MKKLLALLGVAMFALLSMAASPALAGGNDKKSNAFQCTGSYTGITINRNVVVAPNRACTLVNSVVRGRVDVSENGYFESSKSAIRKDVRGNRAMTIFIDTGSQMGGGIGTNRTDQVFVYNSTVKGGIAVARSSETVQICGNTVSGAGIGVVRSGRDILIGDPLTVGCAGNSVNRGGVLVAQNSTDVELVVRGNSLGSGSMYVLDNTGSSDKFVQSNTGGRTLRCSGNAAQFVGSPNPGWQRYQGRCGR